MRSLLLFALLSFCLLVPIVFALNEPDTADLGKELSSGKEDDENEDETDVEQPEDKYTELEENDDDKYNAPVEAGKTLNEKNDPGWGRRRRRRRRRIYCKRCRCRRCNGYSG